jgi:hypothetical protein
MAKTAQTESRWIKAMPNQCTPAGYAEDEFDQVAREVDAFIDELQARGFSGSAVASGADAPRHAAVPARRWREGSRHRVQVDS